MSKGYKDLTGQRFGEWTVIDYAGNGKWNCVCSCGTKRAVQGRYLINGNSKCCGGGKHKQNIPRQDLTGKRFGRWTVLSYAGNRKWTCVCDCGNIGEVYTGNLNNGSSQSCGCIQKENLIGQKFGRLTVVSESNYYVSPTGNKSVRWNCVCECGKSILASTNQLRNGIIVSCGCYGREIARKTHTTHGLTNSRIYHIWRGIKDRCYDEKKDSYPYYGGRGITVCGEWQNDFQAFYDWAMANGYDENLTIDRIDTNGNYEPSNCRWATMEEQQNNKRNNRFFNIEGQALTLPQISKKYNINLYVLKNRVRKGWDITEAVKTPT